MLRWICISILIFSLVLTVGCKKRVGDEQGVRASIEKHLSGSSDLNMAAMDHEIKQVSIDRDHATAQVEFRLKQGGGSMLLEYALQRQNGEWNVLKSQPVGGQNAHPSMDQPPASAPQGGSPQTALPPFNEILNNPPASGSKPLPPGHPPITQPK